MYLTICRHNILHSQTYRHMNSTTLSFILIIIMVLAMACKSKVSSQDNNSVPTIINQDSIPTHNNHKQISETEESVFFEYDSIKYNDISQTVINPNYILYISDLDQNFEIKKTDFDIEPLGYRNTNYQRFYIHFDSVYKSDKNSYVAIGRTRYRDTIRSFEGIITLDSASTAHSTDISRSVGIAFVSLYGHYCFIEDSTTNASGKIYGNVEYDCIIKNGQLLYDTDGIDYSDTYKNRQYAGQWIAHNGNRTEPCNWGDFRIPNSKEFDIGAGIFFPTDEYSDNGWQLYKARFYEYSQTTYDEYMKDSKWWNK